MDNSILASRHIYNMLAENEELTSLVGTDKIYPLRVELKYDETTGEPQEITFPFIIYGRESLEPTYTKNFLTENILKYRVVIVSDDYDNSLDVANAVRHALEGHAYRDNGINICPIRLESMTEETMDDTIIQTMVFVLAAN